MVQVKAEAVFVAVIIRPIDGTINPGFAIFKWWPGTDDINMGRALDVNHGGTVVSQILYCPRSSNSPTKIQDLKPVKYLRLHSYITPSSSSFIISSLESPISPR